MTKEELEAAVKRIQKHYDLVYTRECGFEHGFFKKMAEAGKDYLEKFVKEWTNEMSGDFRDNKTLQTIHEYAVDFFETALKCKKYSTGVFSASGRGNDYLLLYRLNKEKSVFNFQILKRK